LIREGKITSGHGRILAGIEDISQMRAVVDRILNEKLSVRIVEKIISEFKKKKIEIKYKKQEIGLIHLKEKIQRKFGVKVDIVGTSKKGRIEIYYYTLGDLERIEKEFDF
jgi:ParB family chromosome partitioning protein